MEQGYRVSVVDDSRGGDPVDSGMAVELMAESEADALDKVNGILRQGFTAEEALPVG